VEGLAGLVKLDAAAKVALSFAEAVAGGMKDSTLAVATDQVADAGCQEDAAAGGPGSAQAINHNLDLAKFLADYLERVVQGCQQHHGSTVLIVVHDRDVEQLLQAIFNVEAAGCADVFKVDAAKGGRDRLYATNNGIRILRSQAERPTVDVRELLEEHHLAFHDGQSSLGTKIPQPQDCRAIGDHGHAIGFAGKGVNLVLIFGDGPRDPRYSRRVCHRQGIAGSHRKFGACVDFASQVHQENAVGGGNHPHVRQRPQPFNHLLGMGLALGVEGDVSDLLVAPDFDNVDGSEIGFFFSNCRCETSKLSGLIGQLDSHGHAIVAIGFLILHGNASLQRTAGPPGRKGCA